MSKGKKKSSHERQKAIKEERPREKLSKEDEAELEAVTEGDSPDPNSRKFSLRRYIHDKINDDSSWLSLLRRDPDAKDLRDKSADREELDAIREGDMNASDYAEMKREASEPEGPPEAPFKRQDPKNKDERAKLRAQETGAGVSSNILPNGKKVKLKWWPILTVAFICLALMLIAYFLGLKSIGVDKYKEIIDWITDHHVAELAMFIYEFICDSLILPLSPDLVWMVGSGANFPWWYTVLVVGTGSVCGGFAAYGIGVLWNKIPAIRRFTKKLEAKWGAYIYVYGVPFLIMAAILPLPFSTIVTVAGILHLGVKKSYPPCLLRYVHCAIYYWMYWALLKAS